LRSLFEFASLVLLASCSTLPIAPGFLVADSSLWNLIDLNGTVPLFKDQHKEGEGCDPGLDGPRRGGEVRYLGVNGMKAGPTRPRSTSFAAPPAPPAGAPRTPPRPPSFRPLEGAPLPGPPHRLRRRRCAVIAPRPRRSDPRGTTDR